MICLGLKDKDGLRNAKDRGDDMCSSIATALHLKKAILAEVR